jgi:hypothetical protein
MSNDNVNNKRKSILPPPNAIREEPQKLDVDEIERVKTTSRNVKSNDLHKISLEHLEVR